MVSFLGYEFDLPSFSDIPSADILANTPAGTSGGKPIVINSDEGNDWFDGLSGLSNVISDALGSYSSFLDSKYTRELARAQQSNSPANTSGTAQTTPTLGGGTSQYSMITIGTFALLAVAGVYIIKKL